MYVLLGENDNLPIANTVSRYCDPHNQLAELGRQPPTVLVQQWDMGSSLHWLVIPVGFQNHCVGAASHRSNILRWEQPPKGPNTGAASHNPPAGEWPLYRRNSLLSFIGGTASSYLWWVIPALPPKLRRDRLMLSWMYAQYLCPWKRVVNLLSQHTSNITGLVYGAPHVQDSCSKSIILLVRVAVLVHALVNYKMTAMSWKLAKML